MRIQGLHLRVYKFFLWGKTQLTRTDRKRQTGSGTQQPMLFKHRMQAGKLKKKDKEKTDGE